VRTDDLIGMLATGSSAVDGRAIQRRYSAAVGWGAFGATLLMATLLGVREDLWAAMRLPMFWVKLAFPMSLAVAALIALPRLSRPGARLERLPVALAAPILTMWLIAVVSLLAADAGERHGLVFGDTWLACLASITFLSLPLSVGLGWALGAGAPTRPALAGAIAGLAAGAVAAAIYALHCTELAAPFIGIWYLLGMLIPAGVGALAGARFLRW
jgi:hypothetical protein